MLIIGLGNPDETYRLTHHNIGFLVVDTFAKRYTPKGFYFDKKANSLVLETYIHDQKVILAKPKTFMNNSGKAAGVLWQKYQVRDLVLGVSEKTKMEGRHLQDSGGLLIDPQKFLRKTSSLLKPMSIRQKTSAPNYMAVIHDDIDLPLGTIKISVGSGAAGHNGVASIIKAVHTQDFIRLRVGIQPEDGKPNNVEDFVLQEFSKKEQPIVEQSVAVASNALDSLLQYGIEKTMNEYNTK